jgi:hypothetical protein
MLSMSRTLSGITSKRGAFVLGVGMVAPLGAVVALQVQPIEPFARDSHAVAAETQREQQAATAAPPKRAHHAIVYDDASGRVLVAGGSSPREGGACCDMFNDLWAYDGSRWTALGSSGAQMSGMRLAFDSRANRVVSFGGWISGRSLPDLRELRQNRWEPLARLTEMPASEPGFVYDSRRDRFIAFGGSAQSRQANGETWEFDGSGWSKVAAVGPDPRQAFVMVFDERRARTVVFGGVGAATPPTPSPPLGDVWEFDGHTWMKITAPNGPSPRHSAGAAYDSRRNRVLVFGGLGAGGMLGDLWAWNGETWTKLADVSPDGPAPRTMGYLAYDRRRDRVVLFGGRAGWPNDLNDTWEWDGAAWKRIGA